MDHLEHPRKQTWHSRRQWFEAVEENTRGEGSYLVSEQACALTADVQASFCAGAWTAVIILAVCVVDAALRETEIPEFKGNTKKLIEAANANAELQMLRQRRNSLVHVDPNNPGITVDKLWTDQAALENEARRAVELMFEAFYISPGT